MRRAHSAMTTLTAVVLVLLGARAGGAEEPEIAVEASAAEFDRLRAMIDQAQRQTAEAAREGALEGRSADGT